MTSISAWTADGTRKGLGLGDDQVLIVDHNSAWGDAFEELCPLFKAALPDSRIEHMGSTAINGCPAMLILDVSVGLTPLISLDVDVANVLHLIFRAVTPESTLFAIYGPEHLRLANVHVRKQDSESEKWNLIFRDFLRAHPDAVKSYGEIKRAAMGSFPNRAQYSEAKAPFISALRSRIEEWDIARRCEENLRKECAYRSPPRNNQRSRSSRTGSQQYFH